VRREKGEGEGEGEGEELTTSEPIYLRIAL
jgi:hypothetical protein